MKKNYSYITSLIICKLTYVVALICCCLFIKHFEGNFNRLWLAFMADILATLIVFAFSFAFNNASIYDPYWSVVPPFIAWYWLGWNPFSNTLSTLIMLAILLWAIRLTLNWLRGWKGLSHEDWRYVMLREKNPSIYFITNLGGIHLFPTIMVFLGMIPVYYASISANQLSYSAPLLYLGFFISVFATIIELTADEQMRSFKKTAKAGEYIQSGIWNYSRHPNYFGEISFWFGLWVIQMSVAPNYWWTAIGFVAMLAMFLFASIPMMEEKNMKSKTNYTDYVKRVSVLVPWFSGK